MNPATRFVIITGLSGAGKTLVSHCFEDLNFFCVDNIPLELIPKFGELCLASEGNIRNAAIVLDIRGGFKFERLLDILAELKSNALDFEILFLDARNDVLVKRFSETRRKHPLGDKFVLIDAIREERKLLLGIKEKSNFVINTTKLSPWKLKEKIVSLYSKGTNKDHMVINLVSFGFKHGIPMDSDLVFDLRFLPNPHYIKDLREKTGKDQEVVKYIMSDPVSVKFKRKLMNFIDFVIPEYVKEGKSHLNISIGCTGGRHRSVALAEMLFRRYQKKDYKIILKHRELEQ